MMVYETKWTQAIRDAYLKSHPQNFAGPAGSYPIRDASDVGDAWGLAGHAADPAAVRAKIKEIAARLGLSHALPDTAKEESAQRPQKKIGTLKICWLEYNARSLNGRIYPKATCDRIYQSGLRRLADPAGLPITCFVSHETANSNVNTELAGRVTKLWQECTAFWALIDLADTRAGRDMLALAEGGYLKSGSMRVLGVELMHDRNYDLPLVVCSEGIEPELAGIDLTTRPGLADSARITQVLYESSAQTCCIESFAWNNLSIEAKEEHPPAMILPIFLQIVLGMLQEDASKEAHMRVHDHLAGVLDETLGARHGSESARYRTLIEGQMDEAGKAIAMKHAQRLIAAHDESASQLGMKCEGCYKEAFASSDTDQDGDDPAAGNDPDNDGESRKETPVTEEEMLAQLRAKGFLIEAPKTAEEKLALLEARLAEQDAKLKQLTEADGQPTQRQTQVQSQFSESTLQPERLYENGDYLKGELHPKNWRALSNSQVPWPENLDPNLVLSELAPFLEFQLLNTQEAAAGRSLREQIQLGLLD